jgi:hypothetical protein
MSLAVSLLVDNKEICQGNVEVADRGIVDEISNRISPKPSETSPLGSPTKNSTTEEILFEKKGSPFGKFATMRNEKLRRSENLESQRKIQIQI